MARKPRLHAPGVLYHVIVRGNQRQKTFLDPADYQIYLEKLAQYWRRYGVTIYAYCLMPNHGHLLLECGKTPLGKFKSILRVKSCNHAFPYSSSLPIETSTHGFLLRTEVHSLLRRVVREKRPPY